MLRKNSSAFTLIELLVVIAIIGMLATMITLVVSPVRAKARDARRQADIKQIMTALEIYYSVNSQYPVSGGAMVPNNGWSTSNDSSWQTLQTAMNAQISRLPVDPMQFPTGWPGGGQFAYSYYSLTSGCDRQWFMLVYQLEKAEGPDYGVTACDGTFFQYGGNGANTSIKTVGARAK